MVSQMMIPLVLLATLFCFPAWGQRSSGRAAAAGVRPGAANSSAAPATSSQIRSYTKPRSATKRIKTPFGDFALWIDDSQWKEGKAGEVGVLTFANTNGEGFAKIVSERIAIPLQALRNAALSNMQAKDQGAKILSEETRIVNGKQVLALQMAATLQGIPFRFYGYCYSGTSGSLQVWAYTAESVFQNNLEAFDGFLNGLEISDQELPSPAPGVPSAKDGVLFFNAAKMSVKYAPDKWKQNPSTETGRFTFHHSSGDAYALVIAERIGVDMDALPEIALKNAAAQDPNAKIVFRDKRRVNGAELWFLKLEAEIKKIPFVYCGYYYSGKNGTVQVLTFTAKYLFAEYEKDFMQFLNGLSVTE